MSNPHRPEDDPYTSREPALPDPRFLQNPSGQGHPYFQDGRQVRDRYDQSRLDAIDRNGLGREIASGPRREMASGPLREMSRDEALARGSGSAHADRETDQLRFEENRDRAVFRSASPARGTTPQDRLARLNDNPYGRNVQQSGPANFPPPMHRDPQPYMDNRGAGQHQRAAAAEPEHGREVQPVLLSGIDYRFPHERK